MKKIILILIVQLITINSFTNAQDILWKKNYGLSSGDDWGRGVVETNDGGLAIAGYTNSFRGNNDVWLIKTNSEGDTLWTRIYGGTNGDFGYCLKQTNDGGFIIGGATYSYGVGGADFYLIKTDSFGDTLWTRAYGHQFEDFCYSILQTEDNGFIATGQTGATTTDDNLMILKVSESGLIEFEKIYGHLTTDEIGYSIEQIDDGYIVTGTTNSIDGWMIKINFSGDSLWSKTFGFRIHSINKTYDNGFILTGIKYMNGENWDVMLMKTDSLGNIEWERTYDYNNEFDIGYSVQQTSDGGFIVCGGASPPDVEPRGWIIRANSIGDTLWTRFIGSYTADPVGFDASTNCYSVIQAQNGDYIIAGAQTQISFQKEVMLLRIASDIVPVELTSFTATVTQNSVSLNWQTATETNNSGFEIERSLIPNPFSKGEGTFETIGFVPGFGTTTEPKSYSFVDENISSGKYQYRLKQIDFDGSVEYSNTVKVEMNSPAEFSLEQNYPNPFNPATKIKYTIPSTPLSFGEGLGVRLLVYDILGNEVATLVNEQQQPGTYEVEFNSNSHSRGSGDLSSGVYYYQLRAGSFVETKKMILLR